MSLVSKNVVCETNNFSICAMMHCNTAVSYMVMVDGTKKRVGLYKPPGTNNVQAELTTNELSGNVTMRGTGRENRVCPQTYTFALSVSSIVNCYTCHTINKCYFPLFCTKYTCILRMRL